jgi:hypothetical protein
MAELCRSADKTCGLGSLAYRRAQGRMGAYALISGNYRLADMVYGQLLKNDLERLPPGHPDLLDSMDALAATRGFLGDVEGSIGLYLAAADAREVALGSFHPETLAARRRAAESRVMGGDVIGCSVALRWALEDAEAALGPGSVEALTINVALGAVLLSLEKRWWPEALARLKEAHRGLAGLLGQEDRETLAAGVNLAIAMFRAGDADGGSEILGRSVKGLEEYLGKDHPEAQLARKGLRELNRARKLMRAGNVTPAAARSSQAADGEMPQS